MVAVALHKEIPRRALSPLTLAVVRRTLLDGYSTKTGIVLYNSRCNCLAPSIGAVGPTFDVHVVRQRTRVAVK